MGSKGCIGEMKAYALVLSPQRNSPLPPAHASFGFAAQAFPEME
jgi:hypothetical protein